MTLAVTPMMPKMHMMTNKEDDSDDNDHLKVELKHDHNHHHHHHEQDDNNDDLKVEEALALGADPNMRGHDGSTALMQVDLSIIWMGRQMVIKK